VRTIGIVLLFGLCIVLLFTIMGLIMRLDAVQNGRIIERVVETEQVLENFEYSSGIELNERLWAIMNSNGGYKKVIDFFNKYTDNAEVSIAIMEESLNQNVPVTQVFGLAWGESRFKSRAIRRNYYKGKLTSTDRGIMGLNDAHRKEWKEADFWNIKKNVKEGTNYFKASLREYGGHFALAIAGYNAGIYSIPNGIGFITLQHVNNIIEFERNLETDLNFFVNRWRVDNSAK
jgi:hypothetical protein